MAVLLEVHETLSLSVKASDTRFLPLPIVSKWRGLRGLRDSPRLDGQVRFSTHNYNVLGIRRLLAGEAHAEDLLRPLVQELEPAVDRDPQVPIGIDLKTELDLEKHGERHF